MVMMADDDHDIEIEEDQSPSLPASNDAEERSDDSMGDDDDDESEDEDAARLAKAEELKQKLTENPYLYDSHKELISLYKELGELEELREARRAMSKLYPLTEDIWMEWLDDEKQLVTSDQDKEDMLDLMSTAVKDYMSIKLWLEYCSFAIGCGDAVRCRVIMEEALSVAGHHTTDGKLLWDLVIEYEKALLDTMQPAPGSCPSTEQQNILQEQTDKVMGLYRKQLCIPLVGMASSMSEFTQWSGEVTSDIQNSYDQAAQLLLGCGKFETQLDESDSTAAKAEVFDKYISFTTATDKMDTACVKCLYERAVENNPLQPDAWLNYTELLEKLNDNTVISTYERSVRNCPWSGALWVAYCRAAEKRGKDRDSIKGLLETALVSGLAQSTDYLDVWCAYLDLLRRSIDWSAEAPENLLTELRNTFERANTHLLKFYGENGDPECSIPKYWATLEAKCINDMERARQIWNDMMTGWRKDNASAWLEYFNFERSYGDHKHCRRVLQRALKAVTDWPESICTAYVRFEREEGTLDQLYTAQARVKDIQIATAKLRKTQAEKYERSKAAKFSKAGDKFTKPPRDAKTGGKPAHSKEIKKAEGKVQRVQSANNEKIRKGGMPPPPGKPTKRPATAEFKVPGLPPPAEPLNKKPKLDDEKPVYNDKDTCTVFVSNLSFDINEQNLKEIFHKCGEIKEIRIMKGRGDKSKGYAYVEFTTPGSATEAIQLDRQLIKQRPMFVSECNAKRDQTKKLKYDTGMEEKKLFVSGLAFSTTKEELETLFAKHGKVKDVRIVTYKGGNSKGLAYVEYHSADEARKGLLALDGTELNKFTMKVAISNPPPRREQAPSSFVPSLGGASKHVSENQPRGKARTQLSLMPRNMLRKPAQTNPPPATKKQAAGYSEEAPAKPAPPGKPMSNTDFRNMLLKK